MNFFVVPWGWDANECRCCHGHPELLRRALSDGKVLDALMKSLHVPTGATRKSRMSADAKLDAIRQHIEYLRKTPTSTWFRVEPDEILAATIFRAAPASIRRKIFQPVRQEADLTRPVAAWLKNKGMDVYLEVPLGTKRIDVLATKPGFFGTKLVGVELKNSTSQLKRGLDQMTTFDSYLNETYLACTPHMAAEYLDAHAKATSTKHWDGDVFVEKLAAFGFGLMLVEGTEVHIVKEPGSRGPAGHRKREVLEMLERVAPAHQEKPV